MSDRFEEAVRQAARGLSTNDELPLYHDAWARGRRRRLIKRGALGVAGAALAFAAIGIGAGGLGGPQSFETDDVATGLDVVATTTPTPAIEIPTTGPTTLPSPVPGSTGNSGDAAAGTELVEETPVAPPQPTATSAVPLPAVTATPPAATATPVPPATAVPTTPPAPPVPTTVPPPVVLPSPTEVPTTVAEVEPALPEPTPTVPFEYSVPGPTATSVATTTSPQPTATSVATTTSPQPTATSVPATATQSPETGETPSADEITGDEPGDTGGDQASDEPPTTAAAPLLPPAGQRLDPTALADAVIDPNVVPEPDAMPCDSSYDGTYDALCETLEPYPCVDQVEATAGYTAIDTTGDGLLDTCEALNTTSCDTTGDLLADVPCIISIVAPDQ